MSEIKTISESGGTGGLRELFTNPRHTESDLKTVERAILHRWKIGAANMQTIIARLTQIAAKTHVEVMTREGLAHLDGPADANAIRAAGVLVAMEKQNQEDQHLADKNNRLDSGLLTERMAVEPAIVERPVRPTLPS